MANRSISSLTDLGSIITGVWVPVDATVAAVLGTYKLDLYTAISSLTLSTVNSNAVALSSGTINAIVIGGTVPAAGTFTILTADAFILSSTGINSQTGTTYTLQASDNGKVVTCSNASAITVTVPSSLPVGFACTIIQLGAGQVTLSASGVTLNGKNGLKTSGQHARIGIIEYTTNVFNVAGDCAI